MKKIRVAFCLRDMQMGGVEAVLVRTLDKLLECKNVEIYFFSYVNIKTPLYKEYFEKHPQIKCISLYPCKFFKTKLPRFFLWRLVFHFMRDIYRNFKRPFVMHKFKGIDVCIDYHDFCFDAEFRRIKNAKKIAWSHSSINVFRNRGFVKFLKDYDKFVVLTDDFKDEFIDMCPEYKEKVTRIYNPVNVEQIKNKSKEKFDKIAKKYFCCVSRLSPDKDIETILRGFDIFWRKNKKPNVKMVIAGDGNRAAYFKSVANSLEARNQFIFMGVLTNPFVVMKGAMGNILSSYNEGLPTVLIESMIVGTLNISSSCKCGPREILLDGRAGLLFEPGNAEQLAERLGDVYSQKVDTKKMVNLATKSLDRFDGNKIVKEITHLIS